MKPLRQAASLLPPTKIEEIKSKTEAVAEPVVTKVSQPIDEPVDEPVIEKIQSVVQEVTTVDKPTQNRFLAAIKSMLGDSHDENAISSKRVLAFLAFIFCAVGFFVDLFSTNSITPHIYDSMMWIVIAGIGISGLEKFAPKE